MIANRQQSCATCRFFCQETDPENRAYFDENSGECRRKPPHSNFAWVRTRIYHWCGEWQPHEEKTRSWQRITTHPRDERPLLVYKNGGFCRQSGMMVVYWNAAFNKWHDDGDRLFEKSEFSDWMDLPDPPKR